MGSTYTSDVSRGRLAFRLVGWIFGVLTIGYSLFLVVLSIVSSDASNTIHRFHFLGGLAGGGLIGVFSIVLVVRPGWTSAFHVLVAQAIAWTIGGLMGGDFLTGFYVSGPIGVIVLLVLRTAPRARSTPSIALMIYAVIATMPAWIYAVTEAELQHGPAADPHVQMHHWSGVAVAALSIAGAGIATSLRGRGWEVACVAASIAAVLFGMAGLVFAGYAGAPGTGWSWLAVAAGIGFWLLARVEAGREGSAG